MSVLPTGWAETDLGSLCRPKQWKTISKKNLIEEGYPVFGANGFIGFYSEYNQEKEVVAVTCRGASCGNIHLIPSQTYVTGNAMCLNNLSELCDTKYIYYALKSYNLNDVISGSAQPQITAEKLSPVLIKIAPFNEQKRIVKKIDTIFEQLNETKARLSRATELLKTFRQSIIDAACSGYFNGGCKDWKHLNLIDVIKGKPRNGTSPKAVDYETSVKSLTLSATTSGVFKGEHSKNLDIEVPKDSHLWLNPGDIIIQRSNSLEYVGTSAIYNGERYKFIYPDLMMKVVANKEVLPEFLNLVISTTKSKSYFRNNATGTAGNMPKINQPTVSSLPLLIPELDVQSDIVMKVNSMIEEYNDSIGSVHRTTKNINKLEKAILSMAFSGRLQKQDPTDESASLLLEKIQAKREVTKARKKIKKKAVVHKKRLPVN